MKIYHSHSHQISGAIVAQINETQHRGTQIVAEVTKWPGPGPGFRMWVSCLWTSLHSTMGHCTKKNCSGVCLSPRFHGILSYHMGVGGKYKRTASSLLVLVTNVLYTTDVSLTRLIVNRILLNKFYFKFSRKAVIWRNTKAKYRPETSFVNADIESSDLLIKAGRVYRIITIILEKRH